MHNLRRKLLEYLAVACAVAGIALYLRTRPDARFNRLEWDNCVGRKIYLHGTREFVGRIWEVDPDHKFGTNGCGPAVLIRRSDDFAKEWIPWHQAVQLYQQRNDPEGL